MCWWPEHGNHLAHVQCPVLSPHLSILLLSGHYPYLDQLPASHHSSLQPRHCQSPQYLHFTLQHTHINTVQIKTFWGRDTTSHWAASQETSSWYTLLFMYKLFLTIIIKISLVKTFLCIWMALVVPISIFNIRLWPVDMECKENCVVERAHSEEW